MPVAIKYLDQIYGILVEYIPNDRERRRFLDTLAITGAYQANKSFQRTIDRLRTMARARETGE